MAEKLIFVDMAEFRFSKFAFFPVFQVLFSVSLLLGCDDGGSSSPLGEEDSERPGFVRVLSSGKSTVLGTDVGTAKANERPKMTVTFDYDYSIQDHEVTCGEYKSFDKSVNCQKDSLPVSNVNYYDAVLYANAKSKKEKLDTAYTYVKASYDGEGHCNGIEGLIFHPEVNAYRLPTEAEWIFAANMDWNVRNSWTADDDVDSPKKVCSRKKSMVCDMEGNVSEWVNDWLGLFRDTTISNYVGAPNGGSLGERVLKGGSFRNESSFVNRYSRGDVYVVTSTTRASYVGFRLAFGAIPNAVWLSETGLAQNSFVAPLASSATVRKLSGAYRAKLVFRDDSRGNLAYVDYSNAFLSVVEIKDSIDSYHPEISPDGKWVAFCTGLEGVSGKSSVYVRKLNASGEPAIRLDVESAAIPRWNVLESGDTVIVYVSDAGDNSDESTFMKKSTWRVPFSGGKFGKPKKLFDGSYHGGVQGNFAVSGSKLLRAHKKDVDTVWFDSKQACNVSLSKSGNGQTLFLDFGDKTDKNFVGEKYGVHERILIADSTGELVNSIGAPSGYAFDHTEWASSNLIAATLTNGDGAHSKVVAVNTKDSSVTELVEGVELWHPSLWTEKLDAELDQKLSLDSAAAYYSEDQATHYLSYKLRLFWNYKDSLEIVGLGNSHMNAGFSSSLLRNALNMAVIPCDMYCSRYLIENYVLNHCRNIKFLVVGIDFDLWRDRDGVAILENQGSALGYKYDINHDFWKDGLLKGFVDVSQKSMVENEDVMTTFDYYRGQAATDVQNGWYGEDGTAEILEQGWDKDSPNPEGNYQELLNILKMAKKNGVYVIGVVFPISPYYKKTDQYGRHGMLRSTAKNFIKRLKELDELEKYFVLFDENKMGDHDYPSSMAYDYDHLNIYGSEQLTARLDSLLKTLE